MYFLEKIQNVTSKLIDEWERNGGAESGHDQPFQEYNAADLYKNFGQKLTKFLTSWNEDPSNRAKDA